MDFREVFKYDQGQIQYILVRSVGHDSNNVFKLWALKMPPSLVFRSL